MVKIKCDAGYYDPLCFYTVGVSSYHLLKSLIPHVNTTPTISVKASRRGESKEFLSLEMGKMLSLRISLRKRAKVRLKLRYETFSLEKNSSLIFRTVCTAIKK